MIMFQLILYMSDFNLLHLKMRSCINMNHTRENIPYDLIEQEFLERKKHEDLFGEKLSENFNINYMASTPKSETQKFNGDDSYKKNNSLYELVEHRNYELEKMNNLKNK